MHCVTHLDDIVAVMEFVATKNVVEDITHFGVEDHLLVRNTALRELNERVQCLHIISE
jgi:hypothetical protein